VRVLRASGIARRRTEKERAEAFFLCERRRRRRIPSAMREQHKKRAASVGNRAPPYGEGASGGVLPLRVTTTAADAKRDA
jgi:hypothetical protein